MDKYEKRAAKAAKRLAREQARAAGPSEVKVFWVEPVATFFSGTWKCENGHYQRRETDRLEVPKEPIPCDQCDLQAEGWAGSSNTEFVRPDTGECFRGWGQLPPGAIYDSMHGGDREPHNWTSSRKGNRIKNRPGIDGRVLVCMLPCGTPWTIDSRANNCTLPNDTGAGTARGGRRTARSTSARASRARPPAAPVAAR